MTKPKKRRFLSGVFLSFCIRAHGFFVGIVILVLVLTGGRGLMIRDFHSLGLVIILYFLSHFYPSIFQ